MSFQEYVEKTAPNVRLGKIDGRIVKGIAIIVVLAVTIILFGIANASESGEFEVIQARENTEDSTDINDQAGESEEKPQICVYVTGAVKAPGICYLEEGARISDAIDAVGGFSVDAATESVNLAQVASDGQQIAIPTIDEIAQSGPDDSVGGASAGSSGIIEARASGSGGGKVNINTATSEELQTLSGIGKSKAEKIISYRQSNGAFKSVDELTNVSGIGEKTLEGLRDYICV